MRGGNREEDWMKMLERLTQQGWLSFFREIAIIAIGVLLEQAGHSRNQTRVALQVMIKLRDLGQMPAAREIEDFLPRSGTVNFCKNHGLPLANWQEMLAKVPGRPVK